MDYLVAIDLGSTSLKAQVYDLDGHSVATASRPTEKIHPSSQHPEWVVWDPDQIWQGSAAAVREAVEQLDDPALIRGVAVTGMGMDGVPIDAQGQSLYPFISWHDPRTAEQAGWWREQIGDERTFRITGFPLWPIMAAMRILWMKQHEPKIMARADKWLLIEDFLNHKLCGRIATDYSMAGCVQLFDQSRRCWSAELLGASGIDASMLPPPMPSGTRLGEVHTEAAAATGLPPGTPVILGGHDHICGTLPVGAHKPGTLFNVIGTWESVIATLDRPVLTEDLRTSAVCLQAHVAPGMYAAWGGAPAGESLEWYRAQLAPVTGGEGNGEPASWDQLIAMLDQTQPGAAGVMFLPHISAAGCPIDDPKSLGAFVGVSNSATRADFFRAVIEGIGYQFLHIMRSLETALDSRFDRIIVGGGATRNTFWVQTKADMLGRPLEVAELEDLSPLGVAMLAGLGLGMYRDLDEAVERVGRPGRIFQPRAELTTLYHDLFETYCKLYPALRPISHGLFKQFRES